MPPNPDDDGQEAEIIASGDCGYTENDNVTWALDSNGVLTIAGTEVTDSFGSGSPWNSHKDSIKRVAVENGVTIIGMGAFKNCASLTSVEIQNGVTAIAYRAFYNCEGLTSVTIPKSITTINNNVFEGYDSLTDVYYAGSKADWDAINISDENEVLKNAIIHYNSAEPQNHSADSDFIEPEITPSITESAPQDTVNLIETSDEIPRKFHRKKIIPHQSKTTA